MKKIIKTLVTTLTLMVVVVLMGTVRTSAATKTDTMTVMEFVKLVVDKTGAPTAGLSEETAKYRTELGLSKTNSKYVAAAMKAGIIDERHFPFLKRACVYWEAYEILANADEFLRGKRIANMSVSYAVDRDANWGTSYSNALYHASDLKGIQCLNSTYGTYSNEEYDVFRTAGRAVFLGYADETRVGVEGMYKNEKGEMFYSPTTNTWNDQYTFTVLIGKYEAAPASRLKVLANRLTKCNKSMYALEGTSGLRLNEQFQFEFYKTERPWFYEAYLNYNPYEYFARTDVSTNPTWKSSNTSVVTVDNTGLVTAVGKGSAYVSATYHGRTYKKKVTVNTKALALNKTNVTVTEGQHVYLSVDRAGVVEWTSSNTDVATVDATGAVSALKAGTATITAKTHGGKVLTCKILITQQAPSILSLYPHLKVATFSDYAWSDPNRVRDAAVKNSNFKVGGYDVCTIVQKGVVSDDRCVNIVVTNDTKMQPFVLEDIDGYEWIFVVARNRGFETSIATTDDPFSAAKPGDTVYKDARVFPEHPELRLGFEAYDAYTHKCLDVSNGKLFTVDWNGDTYDKCQFVWGAKGDGGQLVMGFRVPVGYDGLVFAEGDVNTMRANNYSLEGSSMIFTIRSPKDKEPTFDEYLLCDKEFRRYR